MSRTNIDTFLKKNATESWETPTELKHLAKKLDRAEKRDLLIKTPDENNKAHGVSSHYAVWNTDKNRPASIASERYTIVQHRPVFEALADALTTLNIPVSGYLRNEGDFVQAYVKFDLTSIEDDSEAGVTLGAFVQNSYDTSHSLKGELWALRAVCSNGMILGNVFSDASLKRVHVGEVGEIQPQIRNFIRDCINSQESLQALVNQTLQDTLEWHYLERLLPYMLRAEKWRNKITDQLKNQLYEKNNDLWDLDKNLREASPQEFDIKLPVGDRDLSKTFRQQKPTRWDLYNAFTNVATHGEKISSYIEEEMQRHAQKILKGDLPDISKLPEIEVTA